ncbi:Lacal_2735 family protein [Wenyingzhuangia sp. IMCC45533]
MFSFLRKKSPLEKLEEQYKKLLKEAHQLSTVNRTQSDAKIAEAEKIALEIEQLKK